MSEPMVQAPPEPAGLVTRLIADGVDAMVLAACFIGIRFSLRALAAVMVVDPPFVSTIGEAVRWVSSVLLIPAYHVLFWTIAGKTPGKWLLGLRVVSKHGERVKPGRALLRFFALTVSIAPLMLGVLAIAWDRKRRAWHDRIAGTLVVYDRAPAGPRVRLQLARASG
jgi:uncharacterized RDD family membrane protein YckC